jgi:UDP-N-acetylmuramoylalanine--D-glutamate ligase
MKINDLNKKKIALLGLGVENYAMLKFLFGKVHPVSNFGGQSGSAGIEQKNKQNIIQENDPISNGVKGAQLTVCDKRSKEMLGEKYEEFKDKVAWKFGDSFNQELYKFDVLFRSPGWPINCPGIQESQGARTGADLTRTNTDGTVLYSPIRLFFDLCPTKNIIGVTGTKGKGTTSSLIFEILKKAGKKVYLGGNIGIAPFEFLPKLKKTDWVVLELSSFQLEDMHASPRIAVMTNFYSEHLAPADPNNPNYHKSLKKYWEAKANIFRWQKLTDVIVMNKRLKVRSTKYEVRSKIKYFTKSVLLSQLPGEHNKENIAAAVEAAKIVKIKPAVIAKAVAGFKGLEHRIELVREAGGVKYYDDSFATTPESAIIALRSFAAPIVLLAGGADKGSDFKGLAREIKKRVKSVILFAGVATPRIMQEMLKFGYAKNQITEVDDISVAVKTAEAKADGEGVVLMSPACASFGMFRNYKERGNLFKKEVMKLKGS